MDKAKHDELRELGADEEMIAQLTQAAAGVEVEAARLQLDTKQYDTATLDAVQVQIDAAQRKLDTLRGTTRQGGKRTHVLDLVLAAPEREQHKVERTDVRTNGQVEVDRAFVTFASRGAL